MTPHEPAGPGDGLDPPQTTQVQVPIIGVAGIVLQSEITTYQVQRDVGGLSLPGHAVPTEERTGLALMIIGLTPTHTGQLAPIQALQMLLDLSDPDIEQKLTSFRDAAAQAVDTGRQLLAEARRTKAGD